MKLFPSKWIRIVLCLLILLLINWGAASWVLWRHYDALAKNLATGQWPGLSDGREINIEKSKDKNYRFIIVKNGADAAFEFDIPGQEISPLRLWKSGNSLRIASIPRQRHFQADNVDYSEITTALQKLAEHLPKISFPKRLLGSVILHPLFTGAKWTDAGLLWRITTSRGTFWLNGDALPVEGELFINGTKILVAPVARGALPFPEFTATIVPTGELTKSVIETIGILKTLAGHSYSRPDGIRRSGAGWMAAQDGHAQMYLQGTPYDIGHQHGSLVPDEVRRVANRLVHGVGLLYSFKKGEWFPDAARKLVERQRPFIAPAYFEEMRGLAEGSGVSLDLIQMANIFPEFFHCSGVAVMGDATVNGELLHARVLDYMVGIGLQDYAMVMAIARTGVNRFVTVGYSSFIGSVTGMNEKQVAIGEMGGDGAGDWDGIPMSLLIRQSLENCNTLEEVERFMRESPRTCEYYYLVSDGKGPSALGIAATPKNFETFGPGDWHERLAMPVKDAVLISGSKRYQKLVERVNERHGHISRDGLIEIIKRPVAMKSNLHNAIFQPQSLQLSVADATNDSPACDQPYQTYSWDNLFSAAPSH